MWTLHHGRCAPWRVDEGDQVPKMTDVLVQRRCQPWRPTLSPAPIGPERRRHWTLITAQNNRRNMRRGERRGGGHAKPVQPCGAEEAMWAERPCNCVVQRRR